jgi:hypothetical protein
MAIITSGKTFANGEQLSADKLNQVITAATFASGAIDPSVMQIVGNAITIADGGVATAKIADGNVTKAKIENVANMKALGNTSGSAAAPQEVDILDQNDMSSDSDTSLATQQSIKAYVDGHGITQSTGTAPYYGVRAWANYNGISDTLNASGNIASVVRNSTGNYTFTFTTAMPDANYSLTISMSQENTATSHGVSYIVIQSTTAFEISVYNPNNSGDRMNKSIINISVIR